MMLAPDVATTEKNVKASFAATTVVTIYAGVMRFQVAPWLTNLDLPVWFDPISAHIQTAVDHAKNWQDELCLKITSDVPQSLIDYSQAFDTAAMNLNNIQVEIEMSSSGEATAEQHQQINGILSGLLTQLEAQTTTLNDLHTEVIALMDDMQQDHDTIVTDEHTVSTNVPGYGVISKQMQADLGKDFLSTVVQSPCIVTVSIKMDIETKIEEAAGSKVELLPYCVALQLLDKAQTDNEAATKALSSVATQWQLLQDLLQDVVNKMKDAADDQVVPILRQVDFKTAQDLWDQLATFARGLMCDGCQQ